ncbi:SRPBCC family protein [Phenylobacterium sp.]|uniref:SRPBCC family protein n=1 Tax=Phenylobacterium sp. TaxID=1871053 RepID=UPI002869FA1A|nr:SRPBCC family protein [Phenylobacterium sp.]
MSQTIRPAAIRKSLTLQASPNKAFSVFTDGIGRWWPKTHHIGASPLVDAVIEPGVGGRWYGRHEDGGETPWGEVLAWEPPGRLVLAWRITKDWGYDPNLLTEIEVSFVAGADGQTHVAFEHRGLERFGDSEGAEAARISMDGGWGFILEGYRTAAEA